MHLRIALAGALLAALPLGAERLPLRLFNTSSGLRHDLVVVVRQDSRGWLWFGTDGGVSRFDGIEFTSYGAADGIAAGWVADVVETRSGDLLFATGGGVCRWLDSFECYATQPAVDSPANQVRSLYEDRSGVLWAGTAGGLFRVERRARALEFASVPLGLELLAPFTEGVRKIVEDRSGNLWLATSAGVARRSPDGRVAQFRVSRLAQDDRVFSLAFDRSDRLWIGHVDDGVFIWLPPQEFVAPPGWSLEAAAGAADGLAPLHLPERVGEVVRIRRQDGLSDERVRQGILVDQEGAIWIGTVRGLGRFQDGRLETLGRENGLPDDGAFPSLIDRSGNLWLGSPSGGAARLKRGGFTTFDASDGLLGLRTRSILEGRDGALYVLSSAERDYVQRFDGKRFEPVAPRLPEGLEYTGWANGQVGVLDRDGDWWLPTGLQGLLRFPRSARFADLARTAPRLHDLSDGLGSLAVQTVYEDRNGDLWIGAYASPYLTVWRRSTRRFEVLDPQRADLPPDAPTVFREDPSGRLWIGFGDGTLGYLDGERLVRVSLERTAPAPDSIHDLHFDSRGRLWVATRGAGLVRIDRPGDRASSIGAYGAAEGLASSDVSCVIEDLEGRIYVGTDRGVDRLDPRTDQITHFTTADGLANNAILSSFRDRRGDLWFGTMQGLSRLRVIADPTPPTARAYVTAIELGGVPQPLARADTPFEVGSGRIRIGFVAPSADLDVEPRYRYRLLGLDGEWGPPTADRAVTYGRLPAGSYRFEVAALQPGGSLSEPATVVLRVLPPLWLRWWFLLGLALLVTAAAYTLHRQRLARALAIERVRARIAADLHDDLGASLSRIAVLSEVASRKAPADQPPTELRQIADTARQLTEEASDMVWAIDPHHDDLGSLLARLRRLAADLLGERGIALEFSGPPEAESIHLSPDQRRHLMLILKEALHNAARHADARRVAVRVEVSDHGIRAAVSDDGKGFEPDSTTPSSTGRGLRNFALRARDLGATVEVRSATGAGTTVTLSMPR